MTILLVIAYVVIATYLSVSYMDRKSGVSVDISEDLKGEFK